jgi:hypothetical protein
MSQKQNPVLQGSEEINAIFKDFKDARLCFLPHPNFKLLVWSRQKPDGSGRMTGNYCKLNQMVLSIVAGFSWVSGSVIYTLAHQHSLWHLVFSS